MNKKLMIAAAGAGKTTYLINRALEKESKVLITTYTRSNEDEIKNKIYNQLGYIPSNIDMQTWFEFLLRHGVRPFQGTMDDSLFDKNIGFVLTNNKSAMYIKESDIMKHYFTKEIKIYSDKISKFIIKCNERLNGEVISRITKIYPRIFIDEIQDLVGYDLDVIKLLVNSDAEILMVGDPRQTTYTTHPTDRYKKYQHGKTAEFIENELNKKHEICKIDKETLNQSHRNNNKICSFFL
jgi:DNA helicase-2/ATP-dependent DNA helicase PcrA